MSSIFDLILMEKYLGAWLLYRKLSEFQSVLVLFIVFFSFNQSK